MPSKRGPSRRARRSVGLLGPPERLDALGESGTGEVELEHAEQRDARKGDEGDAQRRVSQLVNLDQEHTRSTRTMRQRAETTQTSMIGLVPTFRVAWAAIA
eukprot:6208567-Pleurochrysis_carterae.AAC.6